jgi:hypothetical protein
VWLNEADGALLSTSSSTTTSVLSLHFGATPLFHH